MSVEHPTRVLEAAKAKQEAKAKEKKQKGE